MNYINSWKRIEIMNQKYKKIFEHYGQEKLDDIFIRIQEFGLNEKEKLTMDERILLNAMFFDILKAGIDTSPAEPFIKEVYNEIIKDMEKEKKNDN